MIKILIVEDSAEISMLMAITLRMEGYDVAEARNGDDALKLVKSAPPDILLLDVMMPGPDGFEVASQINELYGEGTIPIIFVTARHKPTDVVRGLELGTDYIIKPFTIPEMIARVRVAVRNALRSKDFIVKQKASSIFLCHAKEDKEHIRDLDMRLTSAGLTTWLDEKDIMPGQDWDLTIRKALKAATIVLVCLSPKAVTKKGYVQKEVKMALDILDQMPEGAIFLIPVKLEPCELPDRLSSRQAVNLYEPQGFERLVAAVRFQISQNA